jgi:hypothetical protein
MPTKRIRGHALVKRLEQDDQFFWRCECGAHYGAATSDGHIRREQARERHRIHLRELAGQLAADTSRSEG